MAELTERQMDQHDFVDGAIYDLIWRLAPSIEKIEWDMEIIGEVRDLKGVSFNDP